MHPSIKHLLLHRGRAIIYGHFIMYQFFNSQKVVKALSGTWTLGSKAYVLVHSFSPPSNLTFHVTPIFIPVTHLYVTFVYHMSCKLSFNICTACYRDIDVLFLMDSSGSIGASNYAIMKDFVADVLVTFNVTQNSRIGIITFDSIPTTIVPLATVSDVNDLATTVRGISYSGGGTRTDLALNVTLNALTNKDNIRIGILLTDGQSNRPELTLIAAAAVHAAGIKMYTFGIGNTNPAELEAIASEPHADYSFYISSFNRSSFNELLLLLARQTCTSELLDGDVSNFNNIHNTTYLMCDHSIRLVKIMYYSTV